MQIYDETHRTLRESLTFYRNVFKVGLFNAQYRHILLLLYWPVYGLLFGALERFLPMNFHKVSSVLDEYIPFCEYWIYPYLFWFVFMIGILAYALLFNIPAFKNGMKYTMITYSIAIIIYILYPTMQELRPTTFAHNDIATAIIRFWYVFDTNTNVCPSVHVIGSIVSCFTAMECRRFATPARRFALITFTVLISISTVFIKQHSIVDVLAAVLVCAVAYPFVYGRKSTQKIIKEAKNAETITKS